MNIYNIFINLSSSTSFGYKLIDNYQILPTFIQHILDKTSKFADKSCMLLCNITRQPSAAAIVAEYLLQSEISEAEQLLIAFCTVNYNNSKCSLDYLAPMFANLMQHKKGTNYSC